MSESENVIVYTALVGEYDALGDFPFDDLRAICFTDRSSVASGWEHAPIADNYNNVDERIRLARRYKMLPHVYLPKHTFSIWIDSSMTLLEDPREWLRSFCEFDLSTFKYPDTYGVRECLYLEAEACILRKKDEEEVIREQMFRYRREGYPGQNGLVETSIVLRKLSNTSVKFNEAWWSELCRGSRRDQLSFNYVSWRHNVEYGILPGCRISSPLASYRPHLEDVYI